jgi:DNA topoisomerase-1
MSKYLVIVESPAKEKTISKILGKDFTVKSSYGHVRDLPKCKFGIDINDNFKPTYVNIKKSKNVISNLKKIAKNSDRIYLATDFDREGEAIAWHLKEVLNLSDSQISRVTFHEITPEAIIESIKHPKELQIGLINSQQTRRILDRIVGYKLSPLLWKKVKIGLSAGRVQSVALMIVCNREEEIKNFIPKEYWSINVELFSRLKKDARAFSAQLFSKKDIKFDKFSIKSKEIVDEITKELHGIEYTVKSIDVKQYKRSPYTPYTTSTMQQDASKKLGFSASKTMNIAQKLYEGISISKSTEFGLITYMRTDSLNISKIIQIETLRFVEHFYGMKFLPKAPRIYKTKIKGAQEAHEAIRPTSPDRIPSQIKQHLSFDEFKLYDLIWKRFLASQMADAIYSTTTTKILAKDYIFKSSYTTLIFDGFLKVYNTLSYNEEEIKLPQLEYGETLNLLNIIPQQHFTEPAPRYNEASLIRDLEYHGIGRPSTYAPTIKIILDRLYVRLDGKKLIPTNLGIVVNSILKSNFENIVNVKFTANVEEKLDAIAENKIAWQSVLKDFYGPFEKDLNKAIMTLQKQKIQLQHTSKICPQCGNFMVTRYSKGGQFLGCSKYPKCKIILPLDKYGELITESQETNMKCDKCGEGLVKKIGFQNIHYLSCKNYPKCKTTYKIDKNGNKVVKQKPERTDIKCEKCGSEMLKRIGKRGNFIACSSFPKCRNLQWIKTTKPQK